MARLTLVDVHRIAAKQRPWTIRMECVDPSTNTSKFWFATGRGTNEAVEIGWGRIGSAPQLQLTSFAKFEAKVHEKLGKGYDYADTPFVRMSAQSLNMIQGNSGHTPGSGYALSAANKAKPAPVSSTPVPSAPAPVAAPLSPAASLSPVHVNPSLPMPFGYIRWLRPAKGGGWEALDSCEQKLLDLPFASGKTMLRDFPSTISILT